MIATLTNPERRTAIILSVALAVLGLTMTQIGIVLTPIWVIGIDMNVGCKWRRCGPGDARNVAGPVVAAPGGPGTRTPA